MFRSGVWKNHFDSLFILRIALLVQSIGYFLFCKGGSAFGSFLFLDMNLSHELASQLDFVLGLTFLVLGVFQIFFNLRGIFLIHGFLTLVVAFFAVDQGGSHFSQWTPFAQAIRIGLPFLIYFLSTKKSSLSKWVFRLGCVFLATTFFAHGLEAWMGHPHFIDYIITSFHRLFHSTVSEDQAIFILKCIGFWDIAIAIIVLLKPRQWVFIWMAAWGLMTAMARITEIGFVAYPEVLIRISHIILPLVWMNIQIRQKKDK